MAGKLTKKKITDFLKDKGVYDEIDSYIVEEFLFNLELAAMCKADLTERGLIIPINSEQTLFNLNPSNNAYQTAIKQVLTLSRKMGLDYRSRQELDMLVDTDEDDGFNSDF